MDSILDGHELLRETNEAIETRQRLCVRSQRHLTNNHRFHGLRVGVLLSGGGWRSVLSSTGFLDGLCDAGVMDSVAVVGGLSGGGWATTVLALTTKHFNPFHQHLHPGDAVDAEALNPWWRGQSDAVANVSYDGLKAMLSKDRCSTAIDFTQKSYTERAANWVLRKWLSFRQKDDTFFRMIFPDALWYKSGTVLVPKYSHFLGHQLMPWAGINTSFAKAREAAASGQLPVTCVTILSQSPDGTKDWVEINPFVSWKLGARQGGDTEKLTSSYSENSHVWFPLYAHHVMGIAGSAFQVYWGDILKSIGIHCETNSFWKWLAEKKFVNGQMHVFVEGIPNPNAPPREEKIEKKEESSSSSSVTSSVTAVFQRMTRYGMEKFFGEASATRVHLGELRDAGLAGCNVPFQCSHDREFDVLLVMDASAGATAPACLATALTDRPPLIKEGSLVEPLEDLAVPFTDSDRVRVYHVEDGPTIIYTLGLTEPPTSQVVREPDDVERDVRKARALGKQAGELLKAELMQSAYPPIVGWKFGDHHLRKVRRKIHKVMNNFQ